MGYEQEQEWSPDYITITNIYNQKVAERAMFFLSLTIFADSKFQEIIISPNLSSALVFITQSISSDFDSFEQQDSSLCEHGSGSPDDSPVINHR